MATNPTGTAAPQVIDDVYVYRDNEFEQIRGSKGMYVGEGGLTGAMHLLNEVVTNSIDEEINPNTNGDTIWVNFWEKDQKFVVEDNGRGIPLEILFDVINKKHYSTKFGREFNRYSGGQNGLGSTLCAALSDSYRITSFREGQYRAVHMDGNALVNEGLQKSKSPTKHGTTVEFVPSQKWLGRFKISCDDVEDYMRHLSYVIPERIKLKYLLTDRKKNQQAKTLRYQGIAADVLYMTSTPEFTPVTLSIPEISYTNDDGETEWLKLEFSFTYDRTTDDVLRDSFCNYLHTRDGGTHEQAVEQSIAQFLTRQAKALDPNSKFEVTTDDCRRGLVFVVNADHTEPGFTGQSKSKVSQRAFLTQAKPKVIETLTQYFETNNGLLRKIVQYLRQVVRARQETHKIKSVALKKPSTFLDDAEMKIFTNISDRNYTGYKELILAEGDSAIAAVGSARNTKCQAIFAVTGVIANTLGMKPQVVMDSNTLKTLIKVLGAGFGKDFDITKLKWNAVIICTDGDKHLMSPNHTKCGNEPVRSQLPNRKMAA